MSELSFATAEESEVKVIADILTSATQHKLDHGDNAWGAEGWSEEEVQDAMSESEVYLIKQLDEVVGTVSLQWEDERNWGPQPPIAGYIHRLAVIEGYHGQDIGEQAVDWAAARAAENGRSSLRLDCEVNNTTLCNYYEKLGFVQVGTRPVPEYGDYVAALYERPIEC